MNTDIDVLIVGAGPTGLTLAADLARRGVSYRIIDKLHDPVEHSRAIGIQARTLEMMDIEGIVDQFTSRGVKLHGGRMFDCGKEIVHVTFDEIPSEYPYLLSLPQTETERILTETLESRGGRVERGVELAGMSQDGEGAEAVLRHDGTEERLRARWIAGCDGAHSTVRTLLNMSFEGEEYREAFVLADVEMEEGLPEDEFHGYLSDSGVLIVVPLGRGIWRLVADHAPAYETEGPSEEEIRQIARDRSPIEPRIRSVVWASPFRIHRRMVSSMQQGRAFLLGDAAHIHSPAAAQGMNTGIQDALNLSWKLDLVRRGYAQDRLLDTYNSERLPVERAVLQFTDRATRLIELRSDLARHARDWIVHILIGIGAVQERMRESISQIAVNYRESGLVEDRSGAGGLRAGDRMPNLALADGEPVYTALRKGSHLLLTTAPQAALDEVAAEYTDVLKARIAVKLPPGANREGIAADEAIVVRPDAYIAYRGRIDDIGALRVYLARLFDGPAIQTESERRLAA